MPVNRENTTPEFFAAAMSCFFPYRTWHRAESAVTARLKSVMRSDGATREGAKENTCPR